MDEVLGPRTVALLAELTAGGYQAHRRRGEQPCDECRDGHARYQLLFRARAS